MSSGGLWLSERPRVTITAVFHFPSCTLVNLIKVRVAQYFELVSLFFPSRFVVFAGDVTPIEVMCHLPVVCEDRNIPYAYVPAKKVTNNLLFIDDFHSLFPLFQSHQCDALLWWDHSVLSTVLFKKGQFSSKSSSKHERFILIGQPIATQSTHKQRILITLC